MDNLPEILLRWRVGEGYTSTDFREIKISVEWCVEGWAWEVFRSSGTICDGVCNTMDEARTAATDEARRYLFG